MDGQVDRRTDGLVLVEEGIHSNYALSVCLCE